MKLRRLLLAGCALVMYFGGLGSIPLLEPDEGRYAEIPREMLATGDFVTPHLNGVLYFEKPPLYYWLGAASLASFGPNEFASRFWSALLGLGGVGLAYVLGRSMGGLRTGTHAAVILATSPLHMVLARVNIIDPTLTFFVDGALVCFWLAQAWERGRAAAALWHGVFAASALAVLTKGLIGIVIPAAVIGLYVVLARQWTILARVPWVTGILLFLAIAVPWHVVVARRNPDFLWVYFVREHLLRYATPIAAREEPFWFFPAILLPGLLPWWGLLPTVARLLRPLAEIRREKRHVLFLAVWAGFVVVFFSASESKLIPYVLPAVLPLAVVVALSLGAPGERGVGLARWGMSLSSLLLATVGAGFLWMSLGWTPWPDGNEAVLPSLSLLGTLTAATSLWSCFAWLRGDGRRGFATAVLAAALLLGCFWTAAFPYSVGRTTRGIADYLHEHLRPEDEVFGYRHYPQTLPPYLGQVIGVVGYAGELEFGISRLPEAERARRYPTVEEFGPVWESARTIYLVTQDADLSFIETELSRPGEVLLHEGRLLLIVNR